MNVCLVKVEESDEYIKRIEERIETILSYSEEQNF